MSTSTNRASNLAAMAVLLTPALAFAGSTAPTEQTGLTGLVTAVTALISAVAALVAALRGVKKAKAEAKAAASSAKAADERAQNAESTAQRADERAKRAVEWADRLANAHQDGVVLILSYPGTSAPCRALLEANGWQVACYQVTQSEIDAGKLLPGPHVIADVSSADAIVVEGLDVPGVARLAGVREFRDNVRSGASIVLYTGGLNHRYDLTVWGEADQAVNVPVTAEAAVRASLARREVIARRQGIRPGRVAEARRQLLGTGEAPATREPAAVAEA